MKSSLAIFVLAIFTAATLGACNHKRPVSGRSLPIAQFAGVWKRVSGGEASGIDQMTARVAGRRTLSLGNGRRIQLKRVGRSTILEYYDPSEASPYAFSLVVSLSRSRLVIRNEVDVPDFGVWPSRESPTSLARAIRRGNPAKMFPASNRVVYQRIR